MTEDDARQKGCPFARKVNSAGSQGKDYPAVNRNQNGFAETMCLGSGCMAWQWVGHPDDSPREGRCGLTRL